ncbi:MAG: hypothetical protein U0746_09505 [Gemmataceae bacterium]
MPSRREAALGVGMLFVGLGVGAFARQVPIVEQPQPAEIRPATNPPHPTDYSPTRFFTGGRQDTPRPAEKAAEVRVPSVPDMIREVESIRAEKAKLDKKEADLVKAIQVQLRAQREKLRQLGIGEDGEPPLADTRN